MLLLVIDTTLAACQAAVMEAGRVLALRSEPMQRGHQERLAPLAAEVMRDAGIGFADLRRVAVTTGPGSFTGLRVGLAFAKGVALAREIPCVGVGTLEALAGSLPEGARTLAAIDAGRGQIYLQGFEAGRPLAPPEALDVEAAAARTAQLRPVRLAGSGAALLAAAAPAAAVFPLDAPDPAAIGRLACGLKAAPPPAPIYLRAPDARLPQ